MKSENYEITGKDYEWSLIDHAICTGCLETFCLDDLIEDEKCSECKVNEILTDVYDIPGSDQVNDWKHEKVIEQLKLFGIIK